MTRKETTWVPNFCPSCGGKFPGEHNFCGICGFRREPLQPRLPARNLDPWRWVVGVFFLLATVAVGVEAVWTVSQMPYDVSDMILVGFFFVAIEAIIGGLFAWVGNLIDNAEKSRR